MNNLKKGLTVFNTRVKRSIKMSKGNPKNRINSFGLSNIYMAYNPYIDKDDRRSIDNMLKIADKEVIKYLKELTKNQN